MSFGDRLCYEQFFQKGGAIMSSFIDRMIRAAKLDVHLYEEVAADKALLG